MKKLQKNLVVSGMAFSMALTGAVVAAVPADAASAAVAKDVTVKVSGVKRTSANVFVGKTLKLKAEVKNTSSIKKITWKSSDKKIAKVSGYGVVKGISVGKVKIGVTVKTKFGISKAVCNLTVSNPVKKITLEENSVTIKAGETAAIKVKRITPKAAGNKNLVYSVDKKKIASVDKNGIITGLKKGTAVVTVKAADGSGVTKKVNVTVNAGDLNTVVSPLKTRITFKAKTTNGTHKYTIERDVVERWLSGEANVTYTEGGIQKTPAAVAKISSGKYRISVDGVDYLLTIGAKTQKGIAVNISTEDTSVVSMSLK